jgi:hypothetical protein
MSPDHDSPDYCPIHGIKAMLTADGVAEHLDDLVEAKGAIDAHLARITPVKIPKLKALSTTVHGYAHDTEAAAAARGGKAARRLAYMTLLANEIDAKLARIAKGWA